MRLSLIQSDIVWNDPAENVEHASMLMREALNQDTQGVVFPEMFTTGFSLVTGDEAARGERMGREFLEHAARSNGIFCIGSTPEVTAEGSVFNTAWVYGPSGLIGSYRKVHLFSYGEENSRYSAGDSALTIQLGELRCTVFICYDLRFPPPFAKLAKHTDLFIVVANWPAPRREHWLTLLKARAIENQAYIAGVNRCGTGGGLAYSGDTCAFAPDGNELCHMGESQGICTVEFTADAIVGARATFPTLKDRRPDIYARIG